MPLGERDVNTPRVKRDPLPSPGAQSRRRDENSTPSPRSLPPNDASHSLPQHRVLTTANVSKSRAGLQTTPKASLQPHSKLPRPLLAPPPTLSPATAPLVSKWSTGVADRVASAEKTAEKTAEKAKAMAASKAVAVTDSPSSFTVRHALSQSPTEFTDTSSQSRPNSTPSDSALPQISVSLDKPLPSRPIASMANDLSPSKHSRCLIDASEKTLHVSLGGTQHEWPILTPSRLGASQSPDSDTGGNTIPNTPQSPSARLSASAASMLAAAYRFTNTISDSTVPQNGEVGIDAVGNPASAGHYAIVTEQSEHKTTNAHGSRPDAANDTHQHPLRKTSLPRSSSLRDRLSVGSLIKATPDSGNKIVGFTDFTRHDGDESRPYSPSPANHTSAERTSLAHPPSVRSVDSTPVPREGKAQKTASRIPLPDSKKATLVEIKTKRSSGALSTKAEQDEGLSFGGRRIDSPDPLRVLDHGIRRRQLQKQNVGASNSVGGILPANTLGREKTSTTTSRSKASSPEGTMGSSADEEEVTTPTDRTMHFAKHGYKPKEVDNSSDTDDSGVKALQQSEIIMARPPPSTSPHTSPLETIPSQSLLPFEGGGHERAKSPAVPRLVVKPTEFSAFAKRLCELDDSHQLSGIEITYPNRSLLGLLREVEQEDTFINQNGAAGLDPDTKQHLNATLSMLEGKLPLDTTVDRKQFAELFETLRVGLGKAPKTATFAEDAYAADQFLARGDSTSSMMFNYPGAGSAGELQRPVSHMACFTDAKRIQQSPDPTEVSKWSNSTSSAKASGDDGPVQSLQADGGHPGPPPDNLPKNPPYSIGYPSRVSGTTDQAGGSIIDVEQVDQDIKHRLSSPTLGMRVPGSVRVAREHLRGVSANIPRPKKSMASLGTSTKAFGILGHHDRGRLPSTDKRAGSTQEKVSQNHM